VVDDPVAGPARVLLPWGIVVRQDGTYDDGDQPDPATENPARRAIRVVLELPDFVADSLAAAIDALWDLDNLLSNLPRPDRELAAALRAVSTRTATHADDTAGQALSN
jgi:hypothetical protein